MIALLLPKFVLLISCAASQAQAAQSYCHDDSKTNLILIDRTTAYDDEDKKLFAEGIGQIVDSFVIGDRVVVATIGAGYSDSQRTFDQCKPGCPEAGVYDWFFGTCRPLQARADLTQFKRDLATNIRSMMNDLQEYKHSDIARTIARSTMDLGAGFDHRGGQDLTSLFVFSDLLENSTAMPWPRIVQASPDSAIRRYVENGVVPALKDTMVFVFGFGRFHDESRRPLTPQEDQGLRDFWRAYFLLGGAKRIYIGRHLN